MLHGASSSPLPFHQWPEQKESRQMSLSFNSSSQNPQHFRSSALTGSRAHLYPNCGSQWDAMLWLAGTESQAYPGFSWWSQPIKARELRLEKVSFPKRKLRHNLVFSSLSRRMIGCQADKKKKKNGSHPQQHCAWLSRDHVSSIMSLRSSRYVQRKGTLHAGKQRKYIIMKWL